MNLDNIIKLFESLGITMVIDEKNRITFYDSETKEKMESFYTMNPLPFLSNDDIDYEVTLDKLMKDGRVKTASKNKSLRFGLTTPIINRQRTNNIIISEMDFANVENGKVTNVCHVEFGEGRDPFVTVSTVNSNRDKYETTMFSSGDLKLKKNETVGYYFDELFDEGYDLSKDDMIDVLNSTYLLTDISDYYSPLFPNMKNSIGKAKQSKTL